MRLSARSTLTAICVLLFIFGVVIPFCLMVIANVTSLGYEGAAVRMRGGANERKLMRDYNDNNREVTDLQFSVTELKGIQASVRNELRTLEQYRLKATHDIDYHKETLSQLKVELSGVKQELQDTRSKLTRASHDINKGGNTLVQPVINLAPIIIVRNEAPILDAVPLMEGGPKLRESFFEHCTFEKCFQFSRCSLLEPFGVYVYNQHLPDLFDLKFPGIVSSLTANLALTNSIVDDPSQACVFLVVVGPLNAKVPAKDIERMLHSLPYWNDDGSNHVLVDLTFTGSSVTCLLKGVDTARALVAQSFYLRENPYRIDYDIILPMAIAVETLKQPWKGLPPHLPVMRDTLIYFNMHYVGPSHDSTLGPKQMEKFRGILQAQTSDKIVINTECGDAIKVLDVPSQNPFLIDEWMSCDQTDSTSQTCFSSTFALVVGNRYHQATPSSYATLINALRCGTVPVLVGVVTLPFMEVIDWNKAAVFVPASRFGEVHFILRNIEENAILEYRRQGRFLWETYFSSAEQILNSLVAIVRSRCNHSPPSLQDTTAKTLLSRLGTSHKTGNRLASSNFTVYTSSFWNNPPGPFYHHHLTPFKPGPVSGMQYDHLTGRDILNLPLHIVQGGGITGPYFEDLLLGNHPPEQFTIVMLTYQRNDVLLEALERLRDVQFLAKVVVIWNNEELPSPDMEWNVNVPVEVVTNGRNSLNNRFLPLTNIETEAVLSIDDDVHLRHDEIQFAFRVWREARDRIVGFPGRFHAWDVRHSSWLYNSNYTCELSMVLTGAAFIHKYYMHLYTKWMPLAIRDVVDQYMNCEDIAMNFLVSHITRKPPLKVTSRWTFHCPGCPDTLSTSEEHFNERHVCINLFAEIYSYMPLLYTQFRLDSVLFKTRISSNLEKCYQFI